MPSNQVANKAAKKILFKTTMGFHCGDAASTISTKAFGPIAAKMWCANQRQESIAHTSSFEQQQAIKLQQELDEVEKALYEEFDSINQWELENPDLDEFLTEQDAFESIQEPEFLLPGTLLTKYIPFMDYSLDYSRNFGALIRYSDTYGWADINAPEDNTIFRLSLDPNM